MEIEIQHTMIPKLLYTTLNVVFVYIEVFNYYNLQIRPKWVVNKY